MLESKSYLAGKGCGGFASVSLAGDSSADCRHCRYNGGQRGNREEGETGEENRETGTSQEKGETSSQISLIPFPLEEEMRGLGAFMILTIEEGSR